MSNKHDICEALLELKTLQDLLEKSSTKYFGKLLSKLVGVDTLPFFLYTKDGLLLKMGAESSRGSFFTSNYFRIESVDKETCWATISLLQPLDIHGKYAPSPDHVIKLIKTPTCTELDLSCISAVQPLSLDLLKRRIIIEPKW